MIFDGLIYFFCSFLETIQAALPVPTISLMDLGGSESQPLVPALDGSGRIGVVSPLGYLADALDRANQFIPLDQLFLVLQFIGGYYLVIHAVRGFRYVVELIRG